MRTQQSPGGSMFPYYYKGGEIHCLKYGSFSSNEAALFALMRAEEDFISGVNRRLLVWVDFYETRLSNHVLAEFTKSTDRLRPNILKLAIVGCSFTAKLRLLYLRKKLGMEQPPARFFADPEVAKTWLVTETY